MAISIFVGGCATSPPTQFIALSRIEPRTQPGKTFENAPIRVGNVQAPAILDRPYLVRRTGANHLSVSDTLRWAAPLDEMIRETLAGDLAARLPEGSVVLPGQPRPNQPVRLIVLTIETFSQGPSGHVTLEAQWALTAPGSDKLVHTRHARITTLAASGSGSDIAAAMSNALAQLADQIARAARA